MIAISKGDDLVVSSGVITPTHDFHVVLITTPGQTTTVHTITPPSPDFSGFVILTRPDGSGGIGFTSTGGNIGRDIAINLGASVIMVYDKDAAKWFPVNA